MLKRRVWRGALRWQQSHSQRGSSRQVYRQIAELVARQLSVERIVAVAYAEQLCGWTRAA
jgi:hypothetical protein